MTQCKNCDKQAENMYCSYCGQKTSVSRITIGSLLRDLPHAIFHVDRGFLFNIWKLFKQPGIAIDQYLSGKRKQFYHPASYIVIALILNYLIVKITDLHFYDEAELQGMDSLKAAAIRDYDAMQWWFLEHTYIYILLAIPASSLFLYAIFKWAKKEYNLAETAAVVLFTIAQGVLIQTLIYLAFGWINSGPVLRTVETCNVFILIFYASLVIYQLLSLVKKKIARLFFSLIGGLGLAVVWVASAFLLYTLMT